MDRIRKLLLVVAIVLSATCILRAGLNHFPSQRSSSQSQRMHAQDKLSNEKVIITQPTHDYPSFDVDDVRGQQISYEQIRCSEDLYRPGHKIPNLIHYVWFGIFQINRIQYYAIR